MKHLVSWVGAMGLMISTFAQDLSLAITTLKTTSLIFPFAVKHVDRGTKDVLVQQVKEADNILLLKAASENFPETNVTVITADDSVYTVNVHFNSSPDLYSYRLSSKSSPPVSFYSNSILNNTPAIKRVKDVKWDMVLKLAGIYIKAGVMYCQLEIDNNSPIDYDIDFIRFFIRDKKRAKRTAVQENELIPLYTAGNTSVIKANSQHTIVEALTKFTIPDKKDLWIQIMEKNGGRHLKLKLSNQVLLKARILE